MVSKEDYPKPADEEERLEALDRYDILDTPPEEAFDRITRMATKIFDVPISLVSIIDEDRQWWKSCIGVDRRQTDRSLAFCNYPVVTHSMTVIEDATQDERVKNNNLVTGEMHIRAYAGVPLLTDDNHVLGTLCLIDTEPRTFTDTELEILEGLGEEVYSQLELRRSRQKIQKQTQELRMLENAISSTREGLAVSDPTQPDNPLIYVNNAFEEMTGYSKNEALGRNCRFLQGDDTDPEKVAEMREAIENEEPVTVRLKNYKKTGDLFWNQVSVTPVRDDEGNLTHFVGVQQDVTEYKQIEEELEYRATYDRMTGLLNRETFIDRFQDEMERIRRYEHDLSFILLDLDHFKKINDNHGHRAGDQVLQRLGRILKDQIRSSDIAGRYGGEEFAVVLPETNLSRAEEFACRLCETIREHPFESPHGESISVTTSIGIASLDDEEPTYEELIERADQCLYQVKEAGRDGVKCY